MALAERAKYAVQVLSFIKQEDETYTAFSAPITCHVATLFWAALEARGNATPDKFLQIVQNISSQGHLANILYKKRNFWNWNFNKTKATPKPGSVLFWRKGEQDHSGVVVADGFISGHNKQTQFDRVPGTGFYIRHWSDLKPEWREAHIITERAIVKVARTLNL